MSCFSACSSCSPPPMPKYGNNRTRPSGIRITCSSPSFWPCTPTQPAASSVTLPIPTLLSPAHLSGTTASATKDGGGNSGVEPSILPSAYTGKYPPDVRPKSPKWFATRTMHLKFSFTNLAWSINPGSGCFSMSPRSPVHNGTPSPLHPAPLTTTLRSTSVK